MTPSEIAAAVRGLKPRFLEGLAPSETEAVVAAAKVLHYLPYSVVTNQDHPAEQLFLLVSGRARYFYITPDGRKTLLLWIPQGEIFGGAAFLSKPFRYLVSVETVKRSLVLVWDRATLREFAVRYPILAENALLIASDYLIAYRAIPLASGWQPCWSISPAGLAVPCPRALSST